MEFDCFYQIMDSLKANKAEKKQHAILYLFIDFFFYFILFHRTLLTILHLDYKYQLGISNWYHECIVIQSILISNKKFYHRNIRLKLKKCRRTQSIEDRRVSAGHVAPEELVRAIVQPNKMVTAIVYGRNGRGWAGKVHSLYVSTIRHVHLVYFSMSKIHC